MAQNPLSAARPRSTAASAAGTDPLATIEWMTGQLADLEARSRELTSSYEQIGEQLRLASQLQQDLLPRADLRIRGARVDRLFRPTDAISGDIYDIARLDETHVGISLADATGHGLPAALLTVFIKRSFKGKEISNGSYRIIPPEEILSRLNDEILEADLSHCRFVTALHAVYDEQHRVLSFARGGLPYPIYIPAGRCPRQIRSHGGLVGAFAGVRFETAEIGLQPGDRVLLYTDGLDALMLGSPGPSRPADMTETPWFHSLSDRSADDILESVDARLREVGPHSWHRDDITALLLSVEAERP